MQHGHPCVFPALLSRLLDSKNYVQIRLRDGIDLSITTLHTLHNDIPDKKKTSRLYVDKKLF